MKKIKISLLTILILISSIFIMPVSSVLADEVPLIDNRYERLLCLQSDNAHPSLIVLPDVDLLNIEGYMYHSNTGQYNFTLGAKKQNASDFEFAVGSNSENYSSTIHLRLNNSNIYNYGNNNWLNNKYFKISKLTNNLIYGDFSNSTNTTNFTTQTEDFFISDIGLFSCITVDDNYKFNNNPVSDYPTKSNFYYLIQRDLEDNITKYFVPAYDTLEEEYGVLDLVSNEFYTNELQGNLYGIPFENFNTSIPDRFTRYIDIMPHSYIEFDSLDIYGLKGAGRSNADYSDYNNGYFFSLFDISQTPFLGFGSKYWGNDRSFGSRTSQYDSTHYLYAWASTFYFDADIFNGEYLNICADFGEVSYLETQPNKKGVFTQNFVNKYSFPGVTGRDSNHSGFNSIEFHYLILNGSESVVHNFTPVYDNETEKFGCFDIATNSFYPFYNQTNVQYIPFYDYSNEPIGPEPVDPDNPPYTPPVVVVDTFEPYEDDDSSDPLQWLINANEKLTEVNENLGGIKDQITNLMTDLNTPINNYLSAFDTGFFSGMKFFGDTNKEPYSYLIDYTIDNSNTMTWLFNASCGVSALLIILGGLI